MKKVRINELARECEQPNHVILQLLPQFGVTEKKTHSSSVDEDVAIRIRRYYGVEESPAGSEAAESSSSPDEHEEHETAGEASERHAEPPARTAEPAAPESGPPAAEAEAPQQPEPAPEEGKTGPRPHALPLRPPLAMRGGRLVPPVLVPPAPSAPPAQAAPPAPPVQSAPPAAQVIPPPPAPPQVPPAAQVAPGAPAPPASHGLPGRPAPTPRPGQIISGPRQPLPGAPAQRPIRQPQPAQPTAPAPRQSAPLRPSAPAPRPAPSAPAPRPPMQQQQPPAHTRASAPPAAQQVPPAAVVTPRSPLAGQPAARPVVPPRPDLVARLAQQQQTKAMPGQPQPRPGMPLRPQTAPVPGQPIYTPRGGRPGQPGRPGPRTGPGGPGGARPRGLHPTSPLRPEVPVSPTTDQPRRGQKPRPNMMDRQEREEGRLRPMSSSRRDETSKLAEGKQITIAEGITVKELSEKLGLKANLIIKKLVDRKIFATINQTLDIKTAEDLSRDFGAQPSRITFEEETVTQQDALLTTEEERGESKRPPVVTIMGHVDHGKTSLLDAIRLSNVAEREAGGITQHIGAYSVEQNGRKIVFIDTPGHEAFTRMRARGAKVTDIVVLVVAADDGVMPQTLEAIDHARAAKVPIIVAVNKIDKANAQPERVKQQLADRGLLAEDWGGETVIVPVSAKSKQNLDLLLEMILLVADMQDLKANPDRPALCTVLEAKLDRGRGPVATVIVRNGTLRPGDFFISGSVFGKVRALFDDRGQPAKEAGPSVPVEVIGLEALPEVGENLQVVTDTAKAKQIVVYRETKAREQAMAKSARLSLEQLHKQIKEGETKELPVIIKTDVGGTAEVLSETLQKLSTDKVSIRVISSGVGAITESDVLLATTSNAIIIGFNVRPDRNAAATAEQEKVDIRLHTIIYELTDEIKKAMSGMLEPVFKEVYRGRAEVRETFHISKVGTVAGCLVVDGTIPRTADIRLLRDNVVVFTGKIAALKRFKDDASEVRSGLECGISLENFNDVKPRDIIEAFATERVATEALV